MRGLRGGTRRSCYRAGVVKGRKVGWLKGL